MLLLTTISYPYGTKTEFQAPAPFLKELHALKPVAYMEKKPVLCLIFLGL